MSVSITKLRNILLPRLNFINCRNSIRWESNAASEIVEHELDDELEAAIEVKRNKSGLNESDYNKLHGTPPYKEPKAWYHETLKYKRKMYGMYGNQSGVDPALCWPTKEEIEDIKEFEKVECPKTIQEMRDNALKQIEEARRFKYENDMKIRNSMKNLDRWKKEVREKAALKLAEAEAAKEKREKLIEEVKRHFGYRVDPKEEKFQLMIENKEKEELKQKKLEKKKERQEQFMAKLAALEAEATAQVETVEKPKDD